MPSGSTCLKVEPPPTPLGWSNRPPDGITYDTSMTGPQVVIDTNVFVAALRSQLGAAYHLLTQLGTGKFEMNLSVPLVLEYEDVAKRQADELGLSDRDIADIIDYFCSIGVPHKIYYLWRPFLEDAKDDMVLEVAVAGQCAYIVTYIQGWQGRACGF